MVGPNMSAQYGDIVDFPDATAKRLIERGLAEPVAPIAEDAEPVAPIAEDEEPVAPIAEDEEPVAPIAEDIESKEAAEQKSSGEETAVQSEVETASTRPATTRGRRRKEV